MLDIVCPLVKKVVADNTSDVTAVDVEYCVCVIKKSVLEALIAAAYVVYNWVVNVILTLFDPTVNPC